VSYRSRSTWLPQHDFSACPGKRIPARLGEEPRVIPRSERAAGQWETGARQRAPLHVPVLHGSFRGTQLTEQMNLFPEVHFTTLDDRVSSKQFRKLASGKIHRRITEAVLPTLRVVANPRAETDGPCSLLGWVLPLDNTSFRIYSAGRVSTPGALLTEIPDAGT
jgi:hypothetical protein